MYRQILVHYPWNLDSYMTKCSDVVNKQITGFKRMRIKGFFGEIWSKRRYTTTDKDTKDTSHILLSACIVHVFYYIKQLGNQRVKQAGIHYSILYGREWWRMNLRLRDRRNLSMKPRVCSMKRSTKLINF